MKKKDMKSIHSSVIDWREEKFKLEVYDSDDYSKLKNVTQVYGFVFNEKGEILIIKIPSKGEWSLPGGTPEKYDKDWKETLKREVMEEANVEIEDIKSAGYITSEAIGENKVKAKTGEMIRAIARVKKINPQKADPDTGEINERKFVKPEEFLNYCKWGENGKCQLEIALRHLRKLEETQVNSS